MNQTASPAPGALKRGVKLIDLVMLGAGTAIGAAIFSVLGPAAKVGGSGILLAVALAAVPMALFGVVYAFMASAQPRTAASFEWQRQFTHPLIAFGIVWLRILSNAVVMIVLGRTLVNYAGMVVPLEPTLTVLALFALVFGLNYLGVAIAARVQTVLMIMLLALFALFVAVSAPRLTLNPVPHVLDGGWGPVLAALPLMIQLFLGIETATEVGEEVDKPTVKVPVGLALALAVTVVVYFAVTFTALGLVGPERLASSKAPLLDAATVSLGAWATPLIVTAAVLALTKSMNAVFLVFARFLFAMGRAGVLPAPLARIHPRFGTPHIATIVAFLLASAALLLPSSLLFLLLAVNVPTMMKYLGTCLAAWNVASAHPDVHAAARLKLSKTAVRSLAALGGITAIVIAALGFGTDWRPYALLAGWLVLGFLWYAFGARRSAVATPAEQA